MNEYNEYSEQLERYEQIANEGGYREAWLTDVGEGVTSYAMKCEARGKRPTFAGLMKYLNKRAVFMSIYARGNKE
jgi:hypothetical protein